MSKRYEEVTSVPTFCEFFDALLHSFLYSRGLYPLQAFELRKKYGVPVHICIHDEVRNYIESLCRSLASMLEEHRIDKIEVSVMDTKKDFVKEKLVIEPMSLPRFDVATLTVDELFKLEQHLRASLLKLLQSFASLPVLKIAPNCTWKVKVCAKMAVYLELLEKQKTSGEMFWLFEEDDEDFPKSSENLHSSATIGLNKDEKVECNDEDDDDGPFTIIPLKNIKSKFMEIHLHIEDFSCQEL